MSSLTDFKNISNSNVELVRITTDTHTIWEKSTSRLPDTYQEVEWIQAQNNAYINTNYSLQSNELKIQTRLKGTLTSNEQDLIGNQDYSTNRFVIGVYQNCFFGYPRSGNNLEGNVVTSAYSSEIDEELEAGFSISNHSKYIKTTINGSTTTATNSMYHNISQSNNKIQLFANGASGGYFSSMKLYYMKITDNNTLVRDYVPCYEKTGSQRIGLYGLVNDTFYPNNGTGTFTKGADIGGGT